MFSIISLQGIITDLSEDHSKETRKLKLEMKMIYTVAPEFSNSIGVRKVKIMRNEIVK